MLKLSPSVSLAEMALGTEGLSSGALTEAPASSTHGARPAPSARGRAARSQHSLEKWSLYVRFVFDECMGLISGF